MLLKTKNWKFCKEWVMDQRGCWFFGTGLILISLRNEKCDIAMTFLRSYTEGSPKVTKIMFIGDRQHLIQKQLLNSFICFHVENYQPSFCTWCICACFSYYDTMKAKTKFSTSDKTRATKQKHHHDVILLPSRKDFFGFWWTIFKNNNIEL